MFFCNTSNRRHNKPGAEEDTRWLIGADMQCWANVSSLDVVESILGVSTSPIMRQPF